MIQCLQTRLPNDLIILSEYATKLTVTTAKEGTALAVIKKENPTKAYKAVSDAIVWLQKGLNIKDPMSDGQVIDAAVTIINEYYWLRFEELIMILFRIKTGKTEKLYHAFDVRILCSVIEEYLKSAEVSDYHEKQAKEYKKLENQKVEMSEESRLRFQQMYESFLIEVPDPKELPEVDETGRYILIRHADYYNQLKELLPEMTDEQKKELRSSFVRMNYRDGIQLIDKQINPNN